MSKMSKTIAVLGVVAGLGVAALPLSTYAAAGDVSKDVQLNVSVSETLELSSNATSVSINSVNGQRLIDSDASTVGKQWGQVSLTAKASSAYKIVVKTNNADGTANLTNAAGTAGSNTIPAGAPTTSTGGVASAWGLKNATTGTTSTNSDFSAWDAVGTTVKDFASGAANATDLTAEGDTYDARFGVTTATGTQDGTYTGSVNFTLMANV